MVYALFRMMEAKSGSIKIDGIDIKSLGLHTLRTRLQIIPQDALLYNDTIRFNLVAGNEGIEDEQIWDALQQKGLKEFVSCLDVKLETIVTDGGSNFSFGQRQLLCLTAAILAKPKILVMDEATASVDSAADEIVAEILKKSFKDTTVLAIAYRLSSIAGFDRIMVLDHGSVIEFVQPHLLLQDNDSMFKSLVEATGPLEAGEIRKAALHAYRYT